MKSPIEICASSMLQTLDIHWW